MVLEYGCRILPDPITSTALERQCGRAQPRMRVSAERNWTMPRPCCVAHSTVRRCTSGWSAPGNALLHGVGVLKSRRGSGAHLV